MELTFVEILVEKRLVGHAMARVDETGALTVIMDVTVSEEDQQYIHLNSQGARALRRLLNQSNVVELIRQEEITR